MTGGADGKGLLYFGPCLPLEDSTSQQHLIFVLFYKYFADKELGCTTGGTFC
ncbi:hypothetical protein GCM10010912_18670 [Paenibacillus albidus]|uniref:Uncharacterized protein n=1 Tax=Paenibacillus albidus TaxID=2041023 RepID=A0A917C631_9BACL|nr:hypothetical protein GCM10010912_18670 [Paenibacillus albidus]